MQIDTFRRITIEEEQTRDRSKIPNAYQNTYCLGLDCQDFGFTSKYGWMLAIFFING